MSRAASPKARVLVIHRQPWPPAWKKIAVHLCMLAGKDFQRPVFESQGNIARDLNMGEGSYPLAERALVHDGFAAREQIDPGGRYPNDHLSRKGGRVLRVSQAWFDLHANDPIPPKRGRKTGKASRKPVSTSTSGPTCPPNRVSAPTRRDEPLDEKKAERATLAHDLRRWADTDDGLKERLGGVDLATAPLEILRGMLDEATDLLGSPEVKVATDPHGSPEPLPATDQSRSLIRADHQDTGWNRKLRGEEEPSRRGRICSSSCESTSTSDWQDAVRKMNAAGISMRTAEERLGGRYLRDVTAAEILAVVEEGCA